MTVPGEPFDERVEPDEPVVVRDRRKVDPETGERREQEDKREVPAGHAAGTEQAGAEAEEAKKQAANSAESELESQLAERTADLQRLQAEYTNYRRRVDRDTETAVAGAKASVASDLLPILDDLERANSHGDLTGAFKAVGDKLVDGLRKIGLEAFGSEGEPFDPSVHEAVQHDTSSEVDGPTVTTVLRKGYRIGDRVVRSAMVAVTDYEPAAPQAEPETQPLEQTQSGELPVDGQSTSEQPNQ